MANEQTGGSTAHKSNEWCRYLREKKGLVSTTPSEARNFAAIAGHITTLTAENERLSARVERLESALKAVRDDLNIRAVKGVVAVGYSVWLQINRELEEGK